MFRKKKKKEEEQQNIRMANKYINTFANNLLSGKWASVH